MAIWTGCFHHQHQMIGQQAVSIARGQPRWMTPVSSDLRLAPTPAMMKMEREDYIPAMLARLNRLDAHRIARELDGKILLCWEPPGVFCHRRMVAEWLEAETGLVIPEWGYERDECPPWDQLRTKSELEAQGIVVKYDKPKAFDAILTDEHWTELIHHDIEVNDHEIVTENVYEQIALLEEQDDYLEGRYE